MIDIFLTIAMSPQWQTGFGWTNSEAIIDFYFLNGNMP